MGTHAIKKPGELPSEPVADTPAATVGGWTLVFFAFIPLMMAANGDGIGYGIAAGVMVAAAGVLIIIGRRQARQAAKANS